MAEAAETVGQDGVRGATLPVLPLLGGIVFAALLAVVCSGGTLYYLVRSGKVPLGVVPQPAKVRLAETKKTHDIVLEPLLVNLADEGGRAYLRVSMTLSVEDPPKDESKTKEEPASEKGKIVIEHNPEIRDAALSVIGSETSEGLLAVDGKEKLKARLRAAISEKLPEMKITDLFFTEFLVQR